MVIDTSAIIAILSFELEANEFSKAIEKDRVRLISAGTIIEAGIIVEARWGENGSRELDLFLHVAQTEIIKADKIQTDIARDAYRKYGKGRHAAGLNFGDCFTYALSKVSNEAVLCKGNNFRLTDIALVI